MCYRELQRQIATIAAGLNAAGIGRGSRVALVLPNGPEMASAFLAVSACATCAPLNPSYTADNFAFYLDDLQARALIVAAGADSPARSVAQRRGIPILELGFNTRDPAGRFTLSNASPSAEHAPVAFAQTEDVALVLHTSGTTGKPKQVQLTHANLCASAANVAASLRLTPDDRCLNIMPLFHIHGLVAALLASLAAGSSVACAPGLAGDLFFEWLDELHPTWYTGVPTMHQHILACAGEYQEAIRRNPLRFIRSASAPLSPALMMDLERSFDTPAIEAYGMTEAAHQIASNPLPPGLRRPGSVGLAAGTEIAISNEGGALLPQGERGEVVIRGPNVTSGSADSMIRDSACSAAWLRTGDLGWLDADGYLFLIGRLKETINRGGETISPREIDAAIESCPGVQTAIAFGVPHRTLGEEIVAAVVRSGTMPILESEILEWVRDRMGTTRVPRRIYFVDELPRTESGKVRRSELARLLGLDQPDIVPSRSVPSGQPRTTNSPLAAALTGLWMSELQITNVEPDDDFFLLGGDSLRGMQLLAKIKAVFGVDLPFEVLLREAATVAGMARAIEAVRSRAPANGAPAVPLQAPIPRRSENGAAFLSGTQRRLWFLDQLNPGDTSYNESRGYRLLGEIDVDALAQSVNYMASRHEILRASYSVINDEPRQIVHKDHHIELKRLDSGVAPGEQQDEATRVLLRDEMRRPFDLKSGPLLRAQLLRLGAEDHVLLLTVHHIASDGWSVGVFNRELSAAYAAFVKGQDPQLPELPIQYADFAVWQREWLQGEVIQSQLAYWRNKLSDLSALELPTDRPRPPVESFRGGRLDFALPAPLTTALNALARREGATLFMSLLAAFQVLLHRHSGQEDFAVGTPIAGRGRTELEGLIGFFANTLVLRTDLSGNPAFRELLARVRETALGAYMHQDLPFEKLVEVLSPARDLSRNPLFQVMFVMQNTPEGALSLDGIEAIRLALEGHSAKFDLTLSLRETKEGLQASWEYASDLFDAATIERMAGHYRVLLEAIVADPTQRVGHLPLLTEAERHRLLVEWNDTTADYPRDKCVHQLFEAQVERTPDAVALVFEDKQLTYAELNARANQLAHHLISLGVGPEVLVGICVERSLEMVIGLLAILKAGGAYVPLDPGYPQARLDFMLSDTQAPVLLTQGPLLVKFPLYRGLLLCLDRDWAMVGKRAKTNNLHASATSVREGFSERITASSPAYVVYTSGSTGIPKGVVGIHRGIINRLSWMWTYKPFELGEVFCQKTSLSFVDSVCEIFGPLLQGFPLVVVPDRVLKDPHHLVELLKAREVTRIVVVPSLLRALLDTYRNLGDRLPKLAIWVTSGETLPAELLHRFKTQLPHSRLINLFGSSEVSADVTFCDATIPAAGPNVPIGRPIANTRVYILDRQGEPVPVGVAGELYISSEGLARGYLNRTDLTAEKFLPDPFSMSPGARMYRMGDLARYRPDGNIEYLGRFDNQVKLRGFRIELSEIEAALLEIPALRQVVVLAREDNPGDKRLVAYVLLDSDIPLAEKTIQAQLGLRLPHYMIPSHIVALPAMPLTPNGKLDYKALPAPCLHRDDNEPDWIAPRNERERQVAGAFEKVLGVTPIGAKADFFSSGGHSLLVLTLLMEMEKVTGARLPVRAVFDAPTVEALAALTLNPASLSGLQPLIPLQTAGNKPPFFIVQAGLGADYYYAELLPHLPEDQPVYGLQPPGFDGKQPPCRSIEELAEQLIEVMLNVQAHGPYSIGGLSYGGVIAWEVACQLHSRGHAISLLVLFDSFVPNVAVIDNAVPRQGPLRTQLALCTAKIRYHCSALGLLRLHEWPAYVLGLAKRISQRTLSVAEHGPAKRQHSWHMERVNAAINNSRKRYMPGPYAGKVDYFCVAQVKEIGLPSPHLGWIELAKGGLQVYVVPGWHSHMLREPFVRALAPILRACLDRREIDASSEQACSQNGDTQSGDAALQTPLSLENT